MKEDYFSVENLEAADYETDLQIEISSTLETTIKTSQMESK